MRYAIIPPFDGYHAGRLVIDPCPHTPCPVANFDHVNVFTDAELAEHDAAIDRAARLDELNRIIGEHDERIVAARTRRGWQLP